MMVALLTLLGLFVNPLLLLWALNTLFHLAIPYTLATWFAAAVLSHAFTVTVQNRS